MKDNHYNLWRRILFFWTLFIGIGAVWGAACMFIEPSGKLLQMEAMLPYMQVLPFGKILFQNYLFSGFTLLIVNGLTNLTASVYSRLLLLCGFPSE